MKLNAVLNLIRQGLSVLFPVITYPYALRILGTDNIGKVNFSTSIVSYFALLAMLGTNTYAVREGAKFRDDKKKIETFSREIFTINLIFTVLSYLLLAVTVLSLGKLRLYGSLIAIQSISIILGTLGVEWINTIYEDFLSITIRSIFSHVISLIALFCFVHNKEDYYVYAAITVLSTGISNVINWFYCRKYLRIRPIRNTNFFVHLKPLLILFVNVAVISVYVNFDITMLGWYVGDEAVGIYSVAVKIYTIVKNILVAIYMVAIPRLSAFVGSNDFANYKILYTKIVSSLSIFLIPCAIGMIILSPEIMYFMGGDACLPGSSALMILSVSLVFAIYGGLVTTCLNVTIGKEIDNLIAVIISAVLNVTLNFWFVPNFSYVGAAITTLISELFVLIFCFIRIKNKNTYIDAKKVLGSLLHAVLGSSLMIPLSFGIRTLFNNRIEIALFNIIGCVTLYFIVLWVAKDNYFVDFISSAIKRIRNKM